MTIQTQFDSLTPPMNHGGTRPGAGRPTGTCKPNSRNNRLTQRYSDAEVAAISRQAHQAGYDNLTDYIRNAILDRGTL
jgi:putative alpha-1,2-mannosidase